MPFPQPSTTRGMSSSSRCQISIATMVGWSHCWYPIGGDLRGNMACLFPSILSVKRVGCVEEKHKAVTTALLRGSRTKHHLVMSAVLFLRVPLTSSQGQWWILPGSYYFRSNSTSGGREEQSRARACKRVGQPRTGTVFNFPVMSTYLGR